MKTKIILFLLLFSFVLIQAQEKNKAIEKGKNTFVEVKKSPEPIKLIKPAYPAEARKAKITGDVVVQVLVGIDGKVKDSKILKSSNKVFEPSAMETANKILFTPAIGKDNKPVETWVAIPFRFSLNDNKAEKKPTK